MTTNQTITANFQDGSTPLAPFIVTQPVAQNLPVGGTIALSVTGYGIPAPTFSWSVGGQSVGNGTSNLVITNITTANQGDYSCVLSDSAGAIQSATVSVNVAVPAVSHPAGFTKRRLGRHGHIYRRGEFIQRHLSMVQSTTPLAGSTNTSLTISNVQLSNLGNYSVVITNTGLSFSATSAVVTLTDITKPVITVQPASTNVAVGSNATLSVTRRRRPHLHLENRREHRANRHKQHLLYQYQQCGNSQLHRRGEQPSRKLHQLGRNVLVVAPPVITTMPAVKYVGVGSNCTISAVCTNVAGTYSWFYNTNHALNSTGSSYTLSKVTTNNSGVYSLVLSNIAGVATGSITVDVFNAPSIITQPTASTALPAGSNLDLTVSAVGNSLVYQWSKNFKAIAGATNAGLSISNLTVANAGTYYVIITNQAGKVTSHNAILAVIQPPVLKTKPKSQSLVVNLPLKQP